MIISLNTVLNLEFKLGIADYSLIRSQDCISPSFRSVLACWNIILFGLPMERLTYY